MPRTIAIAGALLALCATDAVSFAGDAPRMPVTAPIVTNQSDAVPISELIPEFIRGLPTERPLTSIICTFGGEPYSPESLRLVLLEFKDPYLRFDGYIKRDDLGNTLQELGLFDRGRVGAAGKGY